MVHGKMLSVVISVYNEEAALPLFYERCRPEAEAAIEEYELIFVNDGSTDRSLEIIRGLAETDERVKYISFSRNFGHEAAMIAGIDYASGDYIICMDADLQHPVECIPDMLGRFEAGYDVISMIRTTNRDAGLIKNMTSPLFYRLINAISSAHVDENASDFFGISDRVASVLRHDYRERNRFLRGFVQNAGFKKTSLHYDAADRVAGHSKYSIGRLISFSAGTIICFSDAPLKLGIGAGVVSGGISLILLVTLIAEWVMYGKPSAFAALLCIICFFFSVLFTLLGIMGAYIAVLLEEAKARPLYVVESTNKEAHESKEQGSNAG